MARTRAAARMPLAIALALALQVQAGQAQSGNARIWDVAVGTPVGELSPDFMIKACGTNGGPASTPLEAFAEFARCPADPETGLHEVWFSYDDEAEYYQRAMRASPILIATDRANNLFDQLVIFSLLIDDAGLVQGHRIISDPREDSNLRINADSIVLPLKTTYGAAGWTCTDLPPREGELPLAGVFRKQLCEKLSDGLHITMETHRYLKPGQRAGRSTPLDSEFEVSVRLEVINADLVP